MLNVSSTVQWPRGEGTKAWLMTLACLALWRGLPREGEAGRREMLCDRMLWHGDVGGWAVLQDGGMCTGAVLWDGDVDRQVVPWDGGVRRCE